MKRKRGHKKKGKGKKQKVQSQSPAIESATTIAAESPNNDDVESEDNSGSEEGNDNDNVEEESKATTTKEEETPEERRDKGVNDVKPDGVFVRPTPTAVYGRLKLKVKTAAAKPPLEPQVGAATSDGGKSSEVAVASVVDKKEDGDFANVVGEKVEDSTKKSVGIKIVSSRTSPSEGKENDGSENDGGKKSGGIKIVSSRTSPSEGKESGDSEKGEDSSKKSGGIKIVSSMNSSPLGGKEGGGSEMVEDGSKNPGGIKIVSLKNSSPSDGRESGSSEKGEDNSKKSGGIKIVSLKNSSPTDGRESGSSEKGEDSSKKSGGIKIVSLKNSSPSDGRESVSEKGEDISKKSGGIKVVSLKNSSPSDGRESGSSEKGEDSSKHSGGIKIVSLKNSSPSDGRESGSSEKGEDSNKKSGGIKIVSSKNLSPSGGKESGGSEMVEDSSKKSGGVKIVSSKSSSPSGGKESGGSEKGEDSSKKSGGIQIVSWKNSSPSGGKESGGSGLSQEEKKTEDYVGRLPQIEAEYNKQELDASLEVISKIMKMDAAEPFNVPVDPIKLGIPDYFDVIDTPMDFGTVRKNLESGTKYMNSEDVYKDVQYIWDNCYKYNNKGDYIVDLMKRVKKNFMKYWVAAGLYTEQSKNLKDDESSPLDEPTTSGYGKKFKKGKGVKRHKDDCLCAICIMKRRRREREAREAQAARELGVQVASPQTKVPKNGLREEYKQEEISHPESPVDDTSSYMEYSFDGDADVEMEDGEMRPEAAACDYNNEQKSEVDRAELHDKFERSGDISEKSVQSDKGDTELHSNVEARVPDEPGSRMKVDAQKQLLLQPEGQSTGYLQQRSELLELEKRRQKLRMLETFRDLENPMLLGLCGTLFPNNPKSVWSGANSLVRCNRSCHRKDIHEAVASYMKPPCKSASSLK